MKTAGVPETIGIDALHIAVATVNGIQYALHKSFVGWALPTKNQRKSPIPWWAVPTLHKRKPRACPTTDGTSFPAVRTSLRSLPTEEDRCSRIGGTSSVFAMP